MIYSWYLLRKIATSQGYDVMMTSTQMNYIITKLWYGDVYLDGNLSLLMNQSDRDIKRHKNNNKTHQISDNRAELKQE